MRATRLRHAPTERSSIPQARNVDGCGPVAVVRSAARARRAALSPHRRHRRLPRRAAADRALRGLRPERPPGARRDSVATVLTGVSAQHAAVRARARGGARSSCSPTTASCGTSSRAASAPRRRTRLRLLLANDVALAGYHLPLDAHPEHGNNALLARGSARPPHPRLPLQGRADRRDRAPSTATASPPPTSSPASPRRTAREPLVFDAGPDRVRTLGIVSGAAANALSDAIDLGLDAFLTGEPKEHVMAQARESGDPLRRRRPLRDRDVRHPTARRAGRGALRRPPRLRRHPESGLSADAPAARAVADDARKCAPDFRHLSTESAAIVALRPCTEV